MDYSVYRHYFFDNLVIRFVLITGMSNDTYAPFPGPWFTLLELINSFGGNHFDIQGHYILDLWLQNQNVSSTCHDQLHVKFEDFVINSFRDNQQKPFWYSRWSLWTLTKLKLKGSPTSQDQSTCEKWGLVINSFQDNQRKPFCIQCHCDLDLWLSDPKINRGHQLVMSNHLLKCKNLIITTVQDWRKPFWHSMSLRQIYLCDKWYLRKSAETIWCTHRLIYLPTDRHTDRQTDRSTLSKQYISSSSKEGIKYYQKYSVYLFICRMCIVNRWWNVKYRGLR